MLQVSQSQTDTIDAYVGKPFAPANLLKTVKNILIKHKDYLLEKNKPLKV
jgi:DNA-binding response OmpR family regulator